jgi:hypothetical protein
MLGLFKSDPSKKLRKQYERLLEEARDLQRSGDLRAYSKKLVEAEEIARQLEALPNKKG